MAHALWLISFLCIYPQIWNTNSEEISQSSFYTDS